MSTKTIINLCHQMDILSSELYTNFMLYSKKNSIKNFWKKMSEEEREHIEFWQNLKNIFIMSSYPDIFEDSEIIVNELEALVKEAEKLLRNSKETADEKEFFISAFWMEFYLLHPAFEKIFEYSKDLIVIGNPGIFYEKHLLEFLKSIEIFEIENEPIKLVARLLTQLFKKNKILADQSSKDFLTEVYNKRGITSLSSHIYYLAKRNMANIGIIIVDIDNFKNVNDFLGHEAGDLILKKTANKMKKIIRKSDIIGRIGGDEFLILFNNISSEELERICEKLVNELSYSYKNQTITVSIGGEILPFNSNLEVKDIIKLADKKLYISKAKGKNTFTIN